MKKVIWVLLFIFTFTFSLAGFMTIPLKGSKQSITLKDGQTFIELKSNGDIIMSYFYSLKNFNATMFQIDKGDTDKDIINRLDGPSTINGKISKFKRTKDTIEFKVVYPRDAAETLYPHITLKEYGENIMGYFNNNLNSNTTRTRPNSVGIEGFYEVFMEKEKPIYYKDGKKLNAIDIVKYADYNLLMVSGSTSGTYYTILSDIILVSNSLNYKKISNNTIFIKGTEDGYLIVKKYSIK